MGTIPEARIPQYWGSTLEATLRHLTIDTVPHIADRSLP
jgi:hypothetical protein